MMFDVLDLRRTIEERWLVAFELRRGARVAEGWLTSSHDHAPTRPNR
jgi:hypothetical protein